MDESTASPELLVLLRPGRAYSLLAKSRTSGWWILWRRPLAVALTLGCCISLLTARALILRLAASAALTWMFVPLLEIASLAALWHWKRPAHSFAKTVDLFFTGHGPWTLWLIGSGAFWAFFPQLITSMTAAWCWLGSAVAVVIWSALLDFCFWRSAMGRSRAAALRDLVLQRALSWVPGILIFGAGSLRADLVRFWR